jgi:hypothetical protein
LVVGPEGALRGEHERHASKTSATNAADFKNEKVGLNTNPADLCLSQKKQAIDGI